MDNGGSESGLNSSPIQPQTTSQWAKAFLIISVFAVCVMSRWSVLPFQELIKRDLHLSDVQLSLIEGLPTSLSILLFAIPFGRVVDRVNRVRLLAGIVFFIGLGELLTALSTTLVTLFAARIMSGLTPVGGIAAISILADLVVPERRGRAFVAFSVCGFLGYAAAFAVGGWLLSLADLLGYGGNWRAVHLVFAVIQSLVFVPLLLTGEPMRQGTGGEAGTQTQGLIEGLWNMRLFLIPFYIASAGCRDGILWRRGLGRLDPAPSIRSAAIGLRQLDGRHHLWWRYPWFQHGGIRCGTRATPRSARRRVNRRNCCFSSADSRGHVCSQRQSDRVWHHVRVSSDVRECGRGAR